MDIRLRFLIGITILAIIIFVAWRTPLIDPNAFNEDRGRGDAPVGEIDVSEAFIIEFPDLFMNIAFKCHGPNGLYTHTREAPPIIIKNDANCLGP